MTVRRFLTFSTPAGLVHRKSLNHHGLRKASHQDSALVESLGIVAIIGTLVAFLVVRHVQCDCASSCLNGGGLS